MERKLSGYNPDFVRADSVAPDTEVWVYTLGSTDERHHVPRTRYKAKVVRQEATVQKNNPRVIIRSPDKFHFPSFVGVIGAGTAVIIRDKNQ